MARYTDIDKLIAEYDRVHVGPAGGARKLMVEAPIADVVEVVRCKDCAYRRVPARCSLWMGTTGENEYFREHGDNFYCAFGTPKERSGMI